MKKTILSKKTWVLALCAFVLSSLLYVACSKDNATTSTTDVTTTLPKQVSEEEILLQQADEVGKTAYQHLRFNLLSHKAEEYINPAIREQVMSDYKKASEEMKNLSTEERIAKNVNDKKITAKQAFYFRSLEATCKGLDGLRQYKDVEKILNDFNKGVLEDKDMTSLEKQSVLNTSVTIRSTIDYMMNIAYQPQPNDLQTRDLCIFGKKFSCIGSVLIGAAQVVVGVVNGASIITGLVSSIVAITNLFTNSSCDCGSTSCFTLSGISMFRDDDMDCAGNLVKFCAFGDGPSPSSFTWTLSELDQFDQVIPGSTQALPNTPDRCANFSPDANLSKKIRLTITAFSSCIGQNATKFFDFTWGDIVGNPGTVIIDGPTNVYVSNNTTYFLNGTTLLNRKNTFNWIFNLFQGSFTFGNINSGGGTNSSVSINWTGASCGPGAFGQPVNSGFNSCWQIGIGGKSTNSCSGRQQWGSTSVAVRKY
jgi:hypothetical protein